MFFPGHKSYSQFGSRCFALQLLVVIHALKAEIKEEIKREVLDSKSKIVDKLKESVRGDLTEIVKKDVAECNAKILGELKDSLLPSIKYGHGELKDNLKQDTRWC